MDFQKNKVHPFCFSGLRPCIIQRVQLTTIDWLVVALYFALNIGIGFYYKARAGNSVSEFFLSGRDVPWWLAGTSMVATTFAADTPLVVTGLVATAASRAIGCGGTSSPAAC